MKPIGQLMTEARVGIDQVVERTGMDERVVKAVVNGNYTPSPAQRKRLADALGVAVDDIMWGHAVPVDHLYGHGTQFGRSP